jgi:hypothetical protein
MVHALEVVHGTLRPGGILLDIRPERVHPWLYAVDGEALTALGEIDDDYRMGTLRAAQVALDTEIAAGRYALERELTFMFAYHYPTADDWLAHMATDWSSAVISPELAARARAEGVGALCILRAIHVAKLRRS